VETLPACHRFECWQMDGGGGDGGGNVEIDDDDDDENFIVHIYEVF